MITVVSGQARSGTSLTMQMLQAAGLSLWWNRYPNCTPHNPYGHFELENDIWKRMGADYVLEHAQNRVIKVFPSNWHRIRGADIQMIYLDRDPACIAPSQGIMLKNEGREHERTPTVERVAYWRADALRRIIAFPNRVIVSYDDLFTGVAQIQICNFLRLAPEAADSMMKCVDPELRHFKTSGVANEEYAQGRLVTR
jgi:hypothetical protein